MPDTTSIVIAGAGIGGLSAAIALQRCTDMGVRLFEATSGSGQVGGGINIQPGAIAHLYGAGLRGRLEAAGVQTERIQYCNDTGEVLSEEPRGILAGHAVPQLSIRRSRLYGILKDAVTARLGAGAISPYVRVESFAHDHAAVSVEAVDTRTDEAQSIETHGLVGADGFNSVIRGRLFPDAMEANHSGMVLWRGVSRSRPFRGGRTMIVAGDSRHRRFIAYPISEPEGDGGDVELNWVAMIPQSEDISGVISRNDREVVQALLTRIFRSWSFPDISFDDVFGNAGQFVRQPMLDREPLASWGRRAVTLIGDAAHPMYPVGAQGGSQAIIDSFALAAALADAPTVEAAFRRYEAKRIPPTTDIVLANRARNTAERKLSTLPVEARSFALDDIARSYNGTAESV